MYIKTDGIVLREVAYQDSDKLLTVLTREYGKLTVRARGVRQQPQPQQGGLPAAGLFRVHAARARRALCRHGGHGKGDVSGAAERSGAFVAGVLFCAGRGRAQPGRARRIRRSYHCCSTPSMRSGRLGLPQKLVKAVFELRAHVPERL